ncbi:uncharacterized protein EI90DRAFT_3026712 [Cantharellus anzutake]|uniref:uncharacterized protein n=1 Tax=Cantharellus anzutake TaxID=1750568 RepID=UPI001905D6F7|nr:uncharacterized protein EI90DRAFT_3026712 [Cantharellus anzutake]KAF8306397.1 hypothetical protein EI90DRAFT_3026712 [Cantharellus anzutake]
MDWLQKESGELIGIRHLLGGVRDEGLGVHESRQGETIQISGNVIVVIDRSIAFELHGEALRAHYSKHRQVSVIAFPYIEGPLSHRSLFHVFETLTGQYDEALCWTTASIHAGLLTTITFTFRVMVMQAFHSEYAIEKQWHVQVTVMNYKTKQSGELLIDKDGHLKENRREMSKYGDGLEPSAWLLEDPEEGRVEAKSPGELGADEMGDKPVTDVDIVASVLPKMWLKSVADEEDGNLGGTSPDRSREPSSMGLLLPASKGSGTSPFEDDGRGLGKALGGRQLLFP